MEATQPKTGKYSFIYGLILGGIGLVYGIMLYSMDAHYSQDLANTIISIVLMVGVILYAIYSYKKANGGFLSLGEALKIGAGTALIAGIITILYTIFLAEVLDPDFASKVMDARMAELEASGEMSSAQIQQQKEMGVKYFWMGYPVILIVNILIGLVIGLIGGLLLKNPKPVY